LSRPEKAIVIGSGIAGIATSIRLAVMGLNVTVFEANDYPGGKLTSFSENGFRFDAGPSLFTMPLLVDQLFEISELNPRNYFKYKEVDTTCHYFYNDGTVIKAYADKDKLKEEINEKIGGYGDEVLSYLSDCAKTYDLTSGIFLEKSLHRLGSYLSGDTLKALVSLNSLNLRSSMNEVNEKKLGHEKLVQLFNRYATYNGSSPYLAPGVLTLIPHLEFNLGTFFPDDGMNSITTSLVKLAVSRGVKIVYNSRVERINVKKRKVEGVQVKGEHIKADIVVSNMDIVPTYTHLLPEMKQPRQVLEQERSSSAIIFYWGIDCQFPELDLHNIFFSEDYKQEFNFIFKEHDLFEDPTVYVHVSSKYCQGDAPPGKENWFVMINSPGNVGQDWDKLINLSRERIIQKLSRILKIDLNNLIESESVLDPRTIEENTSSYRGSLYGASSNHWLSAFIRHPNFHRKIRGLYFCGGSVHPGGGIPLSILSGKIVSELVQNDFRI
jgi:phytoene desaturase